MVVIFKNLSCLRMFALLAVCLASPLASAADDFAAVTKILQRSCTACHRDKGAEGGLNLHSITAIQAGGDSGPTIVPGNHAESLLWQRLSGQEEPIMPPEDNEIGAPPLSQEEQDLIARWIDAGAEMSEMQDFSALNWQPLPEILQPIYASASSPTTPLIAFGWGDRVWLRYYDGQGMELNSTRLDAAPATGNAPTDIVSSLAINRDGTMIAVGGFRKLDLWKFDGSPVSAQEAIEGVAENTGVYISPSGNRIAQLDRTANQLQVRDTDGSTSGRLVLPPTPLVQLTWSPDEQTVLAYLQDGTSCTFIASPSDDAALLVQPTSTYQLPTELLRLALLEDGRVFCHSKAQTLELWNHADDPATAWVRDESFQSVAGVAEFSLIRHDQALVAVLLEQRVVVLLAADGKTEVARFDHGAAASGFRLRPDGKQLLTFGPESPPQLWDVASGVSLATLSVRHAAEDAVQVASHNHERQKAKIDRIAAGVPALEATVAAQAAALVKAEEARKAAVEDLAAKTLASTQTQQAVTETEMAIATAQAAPEKDAAAVEALMAELTKRQEAHGKNQETLQAAKDNLAKQEQIFASTTDAKTNAEAKVAARNETIAKEKQYLIALEKTQAEATAHAALPMPASQHAAFSADGRSVIVSTADGRLSVFETAGHRLYLTLQAPTAVEQLSVTAAGFVVALHADQTVQHAWPLWGRWQKAQTIGGVDQQVFKDRVTSLDFDKSSQRIASGSGEPSRSGIIKVFATSDGALLNDLGEVHSDTIMGIAFAPDGRSIASAAADKLIRVSDLESEQPATTLEGHSHHVLALAWHHDGRRLITAGADQTLRVWDTETASQLRSIGGFSQAVTAVQMVGSSDQAAVSAGDAQLRLVDINSGGTVRNYAGLPAYIYTLSILNRDEYLLTGDHSGTIGLWNLATGAAVK